MTANNIATAAAPYMLIARTYSVMHKVALNRTTAATAPAAFHGSVTSNAMIVANAAAGSTATAFCSAAVARKSTPEQNRCW
jgi:hypothetical protein